jgi:hypothetical protein
MGRSGPMEVYRGYRIALREQNFGFRVHVSPVYPCLPILPRSHFDWQGTREEALAEARRQVDELLARS